MRAKFINEAYGFERSNDPLKNLDVGKDSLSAKTHKFNELIKQGVKFFDYSNNSKKDQEVAKEIYINRIYQIEKCLNKLKSVGAEIISVYASFGTPHIEVDSYRINNNNHIILQCLSKGDADKLLEMIKELSVERHRKGIIVDKDNEISFNVYEDGFSEENEKFLNELKGVRKKYGIKEE